MKYNTFSPQETSTDSDLGPSLSSRKHCFSCFIGGEGLKFLSYSVSGIITGDLNGGTDWLDLWINFGL